MMGPDDSGRLSVPVPPPTLRASDADRMATVLVLQDAMAAGLLTPDEGSERIAAAFSAVRVVELPPLTEDLPPAPVARVGPVGWRQIGVMTVEQVRSSLAGLATGAVSPARTALALVLIGLLMVAVGTVAAGALVHEASYAGPGHFGHH